MQRGSCDQFVRDLNASQVRIIDEWNDYSVLLTLRFDQINSVLVKCIWWVVVWFWALGFGVARVGPNGT